MSSSDMVDKVFTCSCGIHLIRITSYKYESDSETFISFYEHSFYAMQESKVRNYLQRLWDALRGKRHLLFEIMLTPDEVKALINTLQEAANETEEERK